VSASKHPFNPEAASELGNKLRAAREHKGFTPEDVSQAEKIPTGVVNALERGDYSHMGAPVYIRGFIKSYARAVGIPYASLESELAGLDLEQQPTLVANTGARAERPNVAENVMKMTSYVVGSLILLSALYFVTQADLFFQDTPQLASPVESAAPAPSAIEPLDPAIASSAPLVTAPLSIPANSIPANTDANNAQNSVLNQVEPAAGVSRSTQDTANNASAALDASATAQNEAANASSAESEVSEPAPIAAAMAGLPDLSARGGFALKVKQPVWAKVTDADGQVLLNDNLPRDTTKTFSGRAPFTVLVGNAADTQVLLSGESVDFSDFVRGNVARFRVTDTDGALRLQANSSSQADTLR
jgi:cytoskeleton protein RodZ